MQTFAEQAKQSDDVNLLNAIRRMTNSLETVTSMSQWALIAGKHDAFVNEAIQRGIMRDN